MTDEKSADATADEAPDEAPDVAPTIEPDEDTAGVGAKPGRRLSVDRSRLLWPLAGAVAAIGLVVGLTGAFVGFRAYQDGRTESVRDAVLATAETAAMNVTTIDPKNPEKFKQNVESVLTGRALQEMRGAGFQEVLSRRDAQGRVESRVRRAAVTEVNRGDRAGKALVYVDVIAKAPGKPDGSQTMGFLISVRKTDGKYMADTIAPLNAIAYADQQGAKTGGAQPNSTQQPGGN